MLIHKILKTLLQDRISYCCHLYIVHYPSFVVILSVAPEGSASACCLQWPHHNQGPGLWQGANIIRGSLSPFLIMRVLQLLIGQVIISQSSHWSVLHTRILNVCISPELVLTPVITVSTFSNVNNLFWNIYQISQKCRKYYPIKYVTTFKSIDFHSVAAAVVDPE